MADQAPHVDVAQQNLESMLRVARVTLDSAERLIRLQLDSTKQAVEDSARCAAKLAEVRDVQGAFAVQSELAELAAATAMNLSRNIYELSTQAQAEMNRLLDDQMGSSRQFFLGGLDSLAHASPAGTDIFSSTLKANFSAAQAAFDNIAKAARQVAEFADTSIKAASTTTEQAFSPKGRAK